MTKRPRPRTAGAPEAATVPTRARSWVLVGIAILVAALALARWLPRRGPGGATRSEVPRRRGGWGRVHGGWRHPRVLQPVPGRDASVPTLRLLEGGAAVVLQYARPWDARLSPDHSGDCVGGLR